MGEAIDRALVGRAVDAQIGDHSARLHNVYTKDATVIHRVVSG